MAFILKPENDYLLPAIACDQCGGVVTASGYHLGKALSDLPDPSTPAGRQVCSDACYEEFLAGQPLDDEWFAIPIDAYLANLIGSLQIDLEAVRERERALLAAEHTRHEAPD